MGFDYDDMRARAFSNDSPLTEQDYVVREGWRRAFQDPDYEVPRWLLEGAPAGIEEHPKLRGICPLSRESEPQDRPPLSYYHEGHRNYASIEADPAADAEVKKLMNKKAFIHTTNSYREACSYLGKKPVVSKLAMVTKGDR